MLFVVLLVLAFPPGVKLTADGRPLARTQEAQPDIRDIFLSVPIPRDDLKEFNVAQALGDSGRRKTVLEKTDFTAGANVLDVANGYLRIDIPIRLESDDAEGEPRRQDNR